MGVNLEFIKYINNFILKDFKINFTFLNTVNKKNLRGRLKKEGPLIGMINLIIIFFQSSKWFSKLAKNKNRYLIINSNLPIKHNKEIIINKLN